MKKLASIAFALILIVISGFKPMDGSTDVNSKFKAIYLYSFATKYVEWPAKYKEGDFIFGILGESGLTPELEKVVSAKKVGLQTAIVKTFDSPEKLDFCHILYVSPENSDKMGKVLAKLKGKNTLIITERSGLAKEGAAINFVVIDNKVKFELNESNVAKYGLNLNSGLAPLAIVVK